MHQGDRDKEKGVYHINLVDEITQSEIVATVEAISEEFLRPVLEQALDLFVFMILGFHSDNGSEYINGVQDISHTMRESLVGPEEEISEARCIKRIAPSTDDGADAPCGSHGNAERKREVIR